MFNSVIHKLCKLFFKYIKNDHVKLTHIDNHNDVIIFIVLIRDIYADEMSDKLKDFLNEYDLNDYLTVLQVKSYVLSSNYNQTYIKLKISKEITENQLSVLLQVKGQI